MKRILLSLGLLIVSPALLSMSAFSQNSGHHSGVSKDTPPQYCHPCLFYGGDFDAANPSANALQNNLTKRRAGAAVFVPFFVPEGQVWTVTGLFSNNMSNLSFIDPPTIQWSISSGVSTGQAGTIIANGTIHATYTPTGRNWNGMTEYTALGRLTPATAVTLTSGVYWMTAVPVCTNSDCVHAHYYLSDVEDVPAPNHKGVEPNDDSFLVASRRILLPANRISGRNLQRRRERHWVRQVLSRIVSLCEASEVTMRDAKSMHCNRILHGDRALDLGVCTWYTVCEVLNR